MEENSFPAGLIATSDERAPAEISNLTRDLHISGTVISEYFAV